ncbi:methylated-DNA--[protein]-cysteine S-methyltransferase [Exiguobacterium sp. RIT452]|uniref:methylated-DNA--[protein]-cysteine S-methyltransferase n=1 Tax=Exiguobacterium sp. RIT452 TaxID=2315552 RepID=UPI000E752DE4|nr:methylated-DNA--[protein]-cysteine S-methyltransferase [Exiguobacterium sp. RIT452]RJP01772.1 methylated-DNA--[protein]-cysteine S-methyltransferase [Exiguobacterium sp. RIT452]
MPYKKVSCTFGELVVAWEDETVVYLDFGHDMTRLRQYLQQDAYFEAAVPEFLAVALASYEKGHPEALDGIPCRLQVTDFQRRVLTALRTIPFGQTASYGQLARMIGSEKAARAVGGALNRNPIALIYPCHRIIGATGKMTGFASGIAHKEALLAHELGENS